MPQLCIKQQKYFSLSSEVFHRLRKIWLMNGSLSKEYCNTYPCGFVGKNYLVIHFELKCSVRMSILFICDGGFGEVYLGQGLGFFVLFYFF